MERGLSFGHVVRDRRKAQDLTQEDLARLVGCARVTIRKIEYGELRPSKEIAERLADKLAIPQDERAIFVRFARSVVQTGKDVSFTLPDDTLNQLAGRFLKGYELHEHIGAGSFGVVYRASQSWVGRDVVLKLILPQYVNHPDFIRDFEVQAQRAVRLEHPNIVPLYDYWREAGVAALVMRYLPGGDLRSKLHGGPLPDQRILTVMEQVIAALTVGHRNTIIHRQLKPSNVLFDGIGNAYVSDFGIVPDQWHAGVHDWENTRRASTMSPYLAPEGLREQSASISTDIYSLGVMLYELVAGALPPGSPVPDRLESECVHGDAPRLRLSPANRLAALNDVIERATAQNPAARYQDALHFLVDVRRAFARSSTSVDAYHISTNSTDKGTWSHGMRGHTGQHNDETLLFALLETPLPPLENPYKGLRAFAEPDAPDFFGRATLIERLVERLAEDTTFSRFLAIIGPSGSGKSSVVKAGLVPALRRGALCSTCATGQAKPCVQRYGRCF